MNAADAMAARRDQRNEFCEQSKRKRDERPKVAEAEGRMRDNPNRTAQPREACPPPYRSQAYTPLNSPLEQVFMYVRDDPSLEWPEKLKTLQTRDPRRSIVGFIVTMATIQKTAST